MAGWVPDFGDHGRIAGGNAASVLVDARLDLRVGAKHGLRPPAVNDPVQRRQVKGVVGLDSRRVELGFELGTMVRPERGPDRRTGALNPVAYPVRGDRDIRTHEIDSRPAQPPDRYGRTAKEYESGSSFGINVRLYSEAVAAA